MYCLPSMPKMIRSSLLLLACWVAGPPQVWAQSRPPAPTLRVSGTVRDALSKQFLPGVTVWRRATRQGVVTDAQGNFGVGAAPADTLLFRALGYKPYQLVLPGSARAPLVVQVQLQRDSVRLGEVRVSADRANRVAINRALRNLRQPLAPAQPVGPRQVKPKPLFPVDSTPPPPPPGGTPFDWAYNKLSREGKERRKVQQLKVRDAQQKARQRRQEYNKAFKDNKGYE